MKDLRIILSPNVNLCAMEQHGAIDSADQLLTLFQLISPDLYHNARLLHPNE